PRRDNDINLALDQFGRDLGGALGATLRPAILDRDSTTLDPAEFAQPLHEGGDPLALGCRRARAKVPDGRQLTCLLRARGKRPCDRRAAEQRDERAPLHSITSSARAMSVGGISRPRARAVLRLITNSNLVDCWTGRSDGFAPLRILSTRRAERYHASLRLAE